MPVDFNDPRIAKLPMWAQEIIEAGRGARRNAAYWHEKYVEACDENIALKEAHAREHGAAEYDTWVTDDNDSDGIHFGLGVGRPVDFGPPDDIVGAFTVTWRDGGLDIRSQSSALTFKTSRHGDGPDLRVEWSD
jgi:hypothetical protein